MTQKAAGKSKEDRVRFQVTLCPPVAAAVERNAKELDRSQAWLIAWALGCALDSPSLLAKWIEDRLKHPEKHQEWKSICDTDGEARLQVRILQQTMERLELAAAVLNHSPQKLAALMIQNIIEDSRGALWLMKTGFGKTLRHMCVG